MFPCHPLMGLAMAATLAFAAAGAEAQLRYRLRVVYLSDIVSSEEYFRPSAINNHGVVVGSGYRQGDEWYDINSVAHIVHGKVASPLPGTEAFSESYASGINGRNQIVGSFRLPDVDAKFPYLYQNGRYRDLRVENKIGDDHASDINASGQVVGRANGKAFIFDGSQSRYIDVPDAISSQGQGINDHGMVVGNAVFNAASGDYETRAFVYDGRNVNYLQNPLPNSQPADAVDINNADQIAANAYVPDNDFTRAFIYGADGRSTQIASLYTPPHEVEATIVSDLNNLGWAVGQSGGIHCTEGHCHEAFLWRDGQTFSLNDLLAPWQARRWYLSEAVAINDRGQITGVGYSGYFSFETFVLTPVPEPGSWALLLAGLGLVGIVAQQQRRGSAL